jgi:hypothetical protein
MGFGVSLVLIAVGAVLTWAVETEVSGLDITVVGVILMVVGGVGMLLSLAFWGGFGTSHRETVVHERGDRVVERERRV